ncbi:thioredoxin-related protein [Flavobacterium nitrogenifigens]|uniref:Thioredoxin-related protein n=2 Tax=Flavobacterium TaxID=237 RepID=A0A7W7N6H6_9FLAO|nr:MULTISPECIES: thioredoxin family protein [Flavobacterium]MBB4800434.1 thioredoxin-related protein [Flavobacterium nitrogenifigens]MBB6385816.1 thioredoxin-related protein [Flavobacterium notoginsengisoli]
MLQKLLILVLFLSSFFVRSQGLVWRTDINDAVTVSSEQRKPLLIFFTGQGVGQKFQNEIFATRDFEDWSRKNVVLVKLDLSDPTVSENIKEQTIRLKNAFGVEQIPQVCLTEVYLRKGRTSFNKLGLMTDNQLGVKSWIAECNSMLNKE